MLIRSLEKKILLISKALKKKFIFIITTIFIVILFLSLFFLDDQNHGMYTLIGLSLIISGFIFLAIIDAYPRPKADYYNKIIFYKNGVGVISIIGLPISKIEKGEGFFFGVSSLFLGFGRVLVPIIIFKKNNVKDAFLVSYGDMGSKLWISRLFRPMVLSFENWFAANLNKTVCIVLKKPLEARRHWYHFKKPYRDLDKIYVSVDEPDKLIDYLKEVN